MSAARGRVPATALHRSRGQSVPGVPSTALPSGGSCSIIWPQDSPSFSHLVHAMPTLAPTRTAQVGCSLKGKCSRPLDIGRALLLGAAWLAMVAGGSRLYAQEVDAPAADVGQEDAEAQQGRPA